MTTSMEPVEPAATAVAAPERLARWSEVTLVATVWHDVVAVW